MARLRFHKVNLRFGTPASASSFLASSRDSLMSLEKPGSFTSSASGVAIGEPGRITPPTERKVEMRERPWLPPQRSIAMSNALRTRTSSNGFFSVLKTTSRLSVQLDSSTRILSPIACTMRSRSAGETPRNSASTCPPCRAFSIAAACNVNTPLNVSR